MTKKANRRRSTPKPKKNPKKSGPSPSTEVVVADEQEEDTRSPYARNLADRLNTPVRVIATTVDQRPMIIMGRHNPNILTEYSVEVFAPIRTSTEIEQSDDALSEDRQQEFLKRIETCQTEHEEFLWDKVLPLLIGFELAQSKVSGEVASLLDGQALNLAPARSAVMNGVTAVSIQYVADKLGLDTRRALMILKSKLDEQVNRSRPNAGIGPAPKGRPD